MRLTGDQIVRAAALAAVLVVAIVVAALLLRSPGGDYKVKARFQNAAQLVKGNVVQTGGEPIGTVENIDLTPNGEAEITMKLKDDYAPLRRGTLATIRQASLSGVANRYIDLRMAPQGEPKIPDGGVIDQDSTTTAVDLDQLFSTFDPETRKALSGVIRGSAAQFKGKGKQFNEGIAYLNPSLAASSRLFRELNRDTPLLERFIVSSSQLVTDIADRRDDLAGLVDELATTTTAIGNQKEALAESIGRLPPFMRRANTTFVNLRSTLDQVDPLVEASKPVAKRLGPFLSQARAFAADAEPTVRDLSLTIRRNGRANDLINLVQSFPPLAAVATAKKNRTYAPGGTRHSVGETQGAFQQSVDALKGGAREISFARPYTTDFLGWFDDFSTTGGGFDALGATARGFISMSEVLHKDSIAYKQYKRCPGSAEPPARDGSNVLSQEERDRLDCDESDRGTPK